MYVWRERQRSAATLKRAPFLRCIYRERESDLDMIPL